VTILHGNGGYAVIILQIVLSFFTIYFFYTLITFMTNKKIALYAAIIASITPLFWITNVTIMMENAYAFFFFFSVFLLIKYVKTKQNYLLQASLFIYALAVITHTFVIFWAPLYLYIVFLKQKDKTIRITIQLIAYIFIFYMLNILFLSAIHSYNPLKLFHHIIADKNGEFAVLPFNFKGLFVALRNFIIPLLRNNTILISFLASVSLIISFKNDKKIFFFGILFCLPALYTNQWWDSLLNGRHALLAGFGLAFLTAYLLRNKNIVFFLLLMCYLGVVSIPALSLLNKPIPYIVEAQFAATLPKNALFIESHFARPQVQATVTCKTYYVNEPGMAVDTKVINKFLDNKQPVFVSSAALSEPYGLYSGPYLHNLTLSYKYPFILKSILSDYTISPYKVIHKQDNLLIYTITSSKKVPYPSVPNLSDSYRNIDYTDPFSHIINWIESSINNYAKN
jgi:hypothetical protein